MEANANPHIPVVIKRYKAIDKLLHEAYQRLQMMQTHIRNEPFLFYALFYNIFQ